MSTGRLGHNSVLRLSSVEISDNQVAETDGNRLIVSFPREQIVSMSLQRGIKSERPIIDIGIGATFFLIGFYIFLPILSDLLTAIVSGPVVSRYGARRFVAMGLVFIPLGIYLIFDALRKRHFLLIAMIHGKKRKILFNTDISYTELRSFINEAQTRYGYHISEMIPEE